MPDPPVHSLTDELTRRLGGDRLRDWLVAQRWFASKTQAVTGVEVIEQAALADDPGLVLAFAQARFATGTHELYQLPLAIDRPGDGDTGVAFDGTANPVHARALMTQIESGGELETPEGRFSFRSVSDQALVDDATAVRPIGVEQSNTSNVFGDRVVLKLFRKLDAGINPELELLRFLTARRYPNIAPLHGWYEYDGTSLAATLGVAQAFVPDAVDGWALALEALGSDPERLLEQLAELGSVTAEMHSTLASDPSDPAFSPEDPSHEAIALLTATIDEEIERIFLRLGDDARLAPIAGRGADVRERLAARAQIGIGGKQIRIHGDFHLGQTLATPRGWMIIDFEGEPARPLTERRMKRSPLRDVASMLRSFAYATSAVTLLHGVTPPADFEGRARVRFLERYFAAVDPSLLPAGDSAVANMLAIFELEKAIYELRYELDNRPDWVSIPVAGIERILEGSG